MEANCAGDLRVICIRDIRLEVREAINQHLQLHHAQRRVVEDNHLDGQVVHLRGDQLAEQHRQATVTRYRHDLAIRVGDLGAQGHRQGIRHRAVQERTDDAARAERIDVAGGPHVAHARIRGENRVLRGRLVEEMSGVLGVDRTHLLHVARVGAHGSVHDLRVLLDLGLQEGIRAASAQVGEERLNEGLDLSVNREANVRAATQLLRVRVHLNGRGIGQELVVGEVGAQQNQHIGVVHALRGRTVAQQARHTHVEGVVVLDEVLAAQRVADRGLECIRQGDDLVVGALDARAGEDRDLVRLVQEGGGLVDVRRVRG